MKTINLDLTVATAKTTYEGSTELEFIGRTPGNQSVRVKFLMGPSTIGYIAEKLHDAVRRQQDTLDKVKAALKGDL